VPAKRDRDANVESDLAEIPELGAAEVLIASDDDFSTCDLCDAHKHEAGSAFFILPPLFVVTLGPALLTLREFFSTMARH
jgi:hypothetical protein